MVGCGCHLWILIRLWGLKWRVIEVKIRSAQMVVRGGENDIGKLRKLCEL